MAGILEGANIASATKSGYRGWEEMHGKAYDAYHPKTLLRRSKKAFPKGKETKGEKLIKKMRQSTTGAFPKE